MDSISAVVRDRGRANEPTLQGLPTELRLQIYEYLFAGSKIVFTGCFGGYARKKVKDRDRAWPVLLSCRAIYSEAWSLYWSLGRVRAYVTWRQMPEVVPAASLGRIEHLSFRLYTLSARWAEILPELAASLPRLRTLVVHEDALSIHPFHWRGLEAGNPLVLYRQKLLPHAGYASFLPGKKGAYELLEGADWPRNRVLYVPVITNGAEVVPWTGTGSRASPKMIIMHNFGNGKAAVVVDQQKLSGLQAVLD